MKTKFELGEKVFVDGKITAVYIGDKGGIEYRVQINYGNGTYRELNLKEEIIERRVQQ